MQEDLKIPENKRGAFAEPLDRLIAGTREETITIVIDFFKDLVSKYPQKSLEFYIVGDIVAQDFMANDFLYRFVKICIIDEKTQRETINSNFDAFFEQIVNFANPKGTINKEFWPLIKKIILSHKKTLIKVIEGEEDLLILPLIANIPLEENALKYAFYGQPPITSSERSIPEGIVVVEIKKKAQNVVNSFISVLEKLH